MNAPRIAISVVIITLFFIFSVMLLPDSILDIENATTYFPDEIVYEDQEVPMANGDYLNVSGYFYLQHQNPDLANDTTELLVFNSTYDLQYRNNVTVNETWSFEYLDSLQVSILSQNVTATVLTCDVGVAEEENVYSSSATDLLLYLPLFLITIFFIVIGLMVAENAGGI